MPRALHVAMLRNAALLVPASARTEWLAEWRAELCYVEHDATAFCLGSFRDALWLRFTSFSAQRALSLESPFRCVLALGALTALALLVAAPPGSLSLSAWSLADAKQLAFNLCSLYFESLLVLVTLSPLSIGEHSVNDRKSSPLFTIRRWAFFAIKIALLPPMMFLAAFALVRVFPPAPAITLVGLIFGFRWALADQRQRCPLCLHFLSNPVEIRSPARTPFQPHGTQISCARGHGSLYIPGTPASWCNTQRWQYASGESAPRS